MNKTETNELTSATFEKLDGKEGIRMRYTRDGMRVDATRTHPDCLTLEVPWEKVDEFRRGLGPKDDIRHRYGIGFVCGETETEAGAAVFEKYAREMGRSIFESLDRFAKPLLAGEGGAVECVFRVLPGVTRPSALDDTFPGFTEAGPAPVESSFSATGRLPAQTPPGGTGSHCEPHPGGLPQRDL